MSLHEYNESLRLAKRDTQFYALIMAAMLKADSDNIEKLRAAFPETWHELKARYHAPGGAITKEEVKDLLEKEKRR